MLLSLLFETFVSCDTAATVVVVDVDAAAGGIVVVVVVSGQTC